jgi:uncharacterized protein (DUF3820 family)
VAQVSMRMPFGKHKGLKIKDLPKAYLEWLVENIDPGPIKDAAISVLNDIERDGPDVVVNDDAADEFLRAHGYGHMTKLKNIPRGYGKPIRRRK